LSTLVTLLLCIITILVDVNDISFIVVLICVFLMTEGHEHLFMSLLAVCVSDLERCPFLNWVVFFYC
jgi:hypothetical protein